MNKEKKEIKDVGIIGTGPAGFSAALYASRHNLSVFLFGKEIGGMTIYSPLIENYPGITGISGIELMKQMQKQVENLGVKTRNKKIIDIIPQKDRTFVLKTQDEEFKVKTVILATGTEKKKLGTRGEKEFSGKGVHYCAICDAAFYKNSIVAVVGGGDSAFRAAGLLASQNNEIYLIDVAPKFFAAPYLVEKLQNNKKVHLIQQNQIIEIKGDNFVKSIVLEKPYQEKKEIGVKAVFVEVGVIPQNFLAKKLGLALNEKGEVIVDDLCQTEMRGVFAAGDITNLMGTKQIITAAAEGAVAAISAYKYLTSKN